LCHDGPLLINVMVDPRQEFSPRIKSRVDENGQFVSPDLDDMYPFLGDETLADCRSGQATIGTNPHGLACHPK